MTRKRGFSFKVNHLKVVKTAKGGVLVPIGEPEKKISDKASTKKRKKDNA